jgi:hypothetical protein
MTTSPITPGPLVFGLRALGKNEMRNDKIARSQHID